MSNNHDPLYKSKLFVLLDRLSPFVILNLAWFILSIPVVTLFPATGGLYHATNLMVKNGDAGLSDLWEGFREYFWVSWYWGGINVLVYGILVSNYLFYMNFEGQWRIVVQMVVILLGIFWSLLQIYLFPMLVEQKEKRLKTAVRNSAVILAVRPFHTVGWGILLAVLMITAVIVYPSWIIFSATVLLYISNYATQQAVTYINDAAPEKEEKPPPAA